MGQRGVTVGKSLHNPHSLHYSSRVQHAADTENYQNNNRGNQIDNLSVPCNGDCFRVNRLFLSLSLHTLIIFLHCRKIKSTEDDKEHEYNSKDCIEIKRNRPQKQAESINTAVFRKG